MYITRTASAFLLLLTFAQVVENFFINNIPLPDTLPTDEGIKCRTTSNSPLYRDVIAASNAMNRRTIPIVHDNEGGCSLIRYWNAVGVAPLYMCGAGGHEIDRERLSLALRDIADECFLKFRDGENFFRRTAGMKWFSCHQHPCNIQTDIFLYIPNSTAVLFRW